MPSLLPIEDNLDARKLTTDPTTKGRRAADGSVHSIYARSPAKNDGKE